MIAQIASNVLRLHLMANGWAFMRRLQGAVAKTHRHRWHRCVQRVGSVIPNPPKSSGKMTMLASRAAHAR